MTRAASARLLALALLAGPAAFAGERGVARNLILISLDTLRADRLGCYGNPRPTSPELDSMAKAGVLFEDASAAAPWTRPSHASLLTGLWPGRTGATAWTSTLSDDATPLAVSLGGQGFRTAAIVNTAMMASHGFERGFETMQASELPQGQRAGSSVSASAVRWLEARERKRRFFLFLHYMDMHSDYLSLPQYERRFVTAYDGSLTGSTQQLYRIAEGRIRPSERDARHLLDLYDASLAQLDDQLRQLFDYLRRERLLETTLLVITSDHGEEFLEHGGVLHGQTQYQEIVRVPLILRGPGVPAGRRLSDPVSLVDVVPTSLALLGLPVPDGLDGVPLQDLWRKPGHTLAPRFLYYDADVVFPPPAPGVVTPGTSRAVRYGRYKLHYETASAQVQLFDLAQDPGETSDLAERHPEITAVLLDRLRRYLEGGRTPTRERELTPEQLEALRSLGYVGGP